MLLKQLHPIPGISFVLLSLVFAIGAARSSAAEGPITDKPALPGESCQTDPLGSWTPQEKWVWKQACEGKIADFNKPQDYGGKLDPRKSEDWPLNRVLRPGFLETILLHEPYRSALTRHGVHIHGAWFREPLDLSCATLTHSLYLEYSLFESDVDLNRLKTSRLIHLGGSKFQSKLDMDAIQVDGGLFLRDGAEFTDVVLILARIGGNLDMHGSQFNGKLRMDSMEVRGSILMHKAKFAKVNLLGATMGGDLAMGGSKFTGKLEMDRVDVGDTLFMNRGAEFADVDLGSAKTGGNILMEESKFTGTLDMNSLQGESNLFMSNAQFAQVVLRGASIGGLLSLSGSKITGRLNMNALHVEGSLFLRGRGEFAEVVLLGANIRGQLDMGESHFAGKLNLERLHLGGNLLMHDGADFAQVRLLGAVISGNVVMIKSRFRGKMNLERVQVGGHLLMHGEAEFTEVNLLNAHIGGQLAMIGSKFTGTLDMDSLHVDESLFMRDGAEFAEVRLVGAQIGGELDMKQSKFTGKLDMKLVKVQDDIDLQHAKVMSSSPTVLAFAEVGGNLDLSGSTLDSLDLTGSRIGGELRLASKRYGTTNWQTDSKLTLRNTEVGTLEDAPDAWPTDLELEHFTYAGLGRHMATRDIFWLKEWLGRQKRYSPQPYEQLASVLRKAGHTEKANAILYAGRERERSEASGLKWLGLTLLNVFIGYGYRIYYTTFWIIGFVVVGALVFRSTAEAQRHNMPYGIAYSLDLLLPVIRLRERHYDIDLTGWPRYYFYFHRLMGYVLASLLIAGLSGLAK